MDCTNICKGLMKNKIIISEKEGRNECMHFKTVI